MTDADRPATLDQEIAALRTIVVNLAGLDDETRRRVMLYLVDRFGQPTPRGGGSDRG